MLSVSAGLASFTFMSTLPNHRCRGIQGVLMRVRLGRAWELGADTACVQCEPNGGTARNAKRLGFRPLYSRTRRTLSVRR